MMQELTPQTEYREFMIFSVSELNKIDFSQVLEESEDTLSKSVDKLKTFVKWSGPDIPSSVQSLNTKEGPYTYDEIMNILNTPEWSLPDPLIT